MPISMLYFLVATDLTLVQVGAAISLASLVALPTGPLIGSVVDRIGAKQVLLAGNALQGAGFVAYLFSDSFVAVTAWTVVVAVGRTAFWGSYGNIVAAISVPGEREKWFGFLGALRNVGFAARRAASPVSRSRSGRRRRTPRSSSPTPCRTPWRSCCCSRCRRPSASEHEPQPGSWATVLRDRPYRVLWFAQLAFSTSMMVLNFAMPVYAITVLGLPGWVTGAVFTINTIMVGLRPGAGRAGDDRPGPLAGPGGRPTCSSRRRSSCMLGATGRRHRAGRGRRAGRLGGLHARRARRRTGARRAGGGGGARPPARPVPLADPAGLERRRARSRR